MTATLHIFGSGGHGREVAWLARDVWTDGEIDFVVDRPEYLSGAVDGHPVYLLADIRPRPGDAFVVALGDPDQRRRAAADCAAAGLVPTSLVHPGTHHSEAVEIGPGSVVAAGCVLTTDVRLGRHVHVNVGCTISHDAVLEDYATLSPGVHIAGNVTVEAGAFLGIGASVVNGTASERLVIGAGSVVAAGACVTRSVAPGAMVAGVPATRRR